MMQLDIFSLPIQSSSSELPKAITPVDPKVEAALNSLLELKEFALSQFQVGSRIIAGDLHGAIASVNGKLANVLFDGEPKARAVFLDCLELENKPLTVGCTVRSRTSFKEQTGKLLRFEVIADVEFAIVEFLFRNSVIQYPCTITTLEVVT
jgi:hypothetical protein